MAIFFKYGKRAVKKYDDLCPDKLVYLKAGKYFLDERSFQLLYLDDDNQDPIYMEDTNSDLFYADMNIDFADLNVPFILNKKGEFIWANGNEGSSSIERLFSR